MTSLYEMYETSEDLETKGVDLQIGPAKFRVARAGGENTKFRKRVEVLTRPHRKQIQSGNMDPKVMEQLSMEAMIDTVLLGWTGVTGKDGKEIKYSKAAAKKLFTDLPDLYLTIVEEAGNHANFRAALVEEDAKN